MTGCSAIKPNGERCRSIAATGSDYCPAHEPSRAEARKRAASKAARSKGGSTRGEIQQLKDQVKTVIAGVLAAKIDKGVASVMLQGYNTLLRATDLERKIIELDELEERIRALEAEAVEHGYQPRSGRFGS